MLWLSICWSSFHRIEAKILPSCFILCIRQITTFFRFYPTIFLQNSLNAWRVQWIRSKLVFLFENHPTHFWSILDSPQTVLSLLYITWNAETNVYIQNWVRSLCDWSLCFRWYSTFRMNTPKHIHHYLTISYSTRTMSGSVWASSRTDNKYFIASDAPPASPSSLLPYPSSKNAASWDCMNMNWNKTTQTKNEWVRQRKQSLAIQEKTYFHTKWIGYNKDSHHEFKEIKISFYFLIFIDKKGWANACSGVIRLSGSNKKQRLIKSTRCVNTIHTKT